MLLAVHLTPQVYMQSITTPFLRRAPQVQSEADRDFNSTPFHFIETEWCGGNAPPDISFAKVHVQPHHLTASLSSIPFHY